jgi:hypothetical protein
MHPLAFRRPESMGGEPMSLRYPIPARAQLRRELLLVIEAHSASTGTEDTKAALDALICLVCELRADGTTIDQLAFLVGLVGEMEDGVDNV